MALREFSGSRKSLGLEEKIQLLNYHKETKCTIRELAKHFNISKTQAGLIIKQKQVLYDRWRSGNVSLSTKRRKVMNLEEKIQLLNYHKETKCSLRKLADHFNIGKTQAGLIIKKGQVLYERWLSGSASLASKRLSNAGFEIDKKIHEWYLTKKKGNQDVSGAALQSKALELAKDLGYKSFKASNGWLAKFVKRHDISFKESKNQDQTKCKIGKKSNNQNVDFNEWSKLLSSIIERYSEDDIFSAVQTGLFFRIAPDDISYLLGETCEEGTLSEDRLTVLFCTSMSGKKEKPLVIVNIDAQETENFKSVDVICKQNNFSWLNKSAINEWLTDLNNRMIEQKRNIVLFLDHSLPLHSCNLSNIRVMYFPCIFFNNQRINQSIIQNFKVIYRSQMLKHLIDNKEKLLNDSNVDNFISVPQALKWINFSWKELSQNTIHKCFEEFFFNVTSDSVCDEDASVTLNDISDLLCAYDSHVSAADYVSIDDYLETVGDHPTPVENLVDVNRDENLNESKNVMPDDIANNFYSESLKSLKQLEEFYLLQNDSNGVSLVKQLITHHENVINSKNIDKHNS